MIFIFDSPEGQSRVELNFVGFNSFNIIMNSFIEYIENEY